MPQIKYYEVTQTRTVKVSANSPQDAMIIASREFAKEAKEPVLVPEEEIWGHTTTQIEVTNVDIRRESY